MTLLTICQDAANEIGIVQPTIIVGSTNPDNQKLLRLANKVGIDIKESADWQVLRDETTFTGLATEKQTSILSADFDRFVPETFWDRTNIKLLSQVSSVDWQSLKATAYDGDRHKFIYRGDDIYIYPVLEGGESLAFEYIKKNWCKSSAGTEQSTWVADTDVGIIDEELITLALIQAYKESDGLPSDGAYISFDKRFKRLTKKDKLPVPILVAGDIFGGGRHSTGNPMVSSSEIDG